MNTIGVHRIAPGKTEGVASWPHTTLWQYSWQQAEHQKENPAGSWFMMLWIKSFSTSRWNKGNMHLIEITLNFECLSFLRLVICSMVNTLMQSWAAAVNFSFPSALGSQGWTIDALQGTVFLSYDGRLIRCSECFELPHFQLTMASQDLTLA